MIIQSCMLERHPPWVSSLSLVADGHAVMVTFSLRAWALIDALSHGAFEFWANGLERRDEWVTLRIPIAQAGSPEWKHTQIALATLRDIVATFRKVDCTGLRGEAVEQLVWIDGISLRFRAADVALAASPTFAAFIRRSSREVFERVSSTIIRAERTISNRNDVPLTHGAFCDSGTLHLLVGDDCACVGVSGADLPRSEHEGWAAYGHNLDTADHVLLVLVALAALEDECRNALRN